MSNTVKKLEHEEQMNAMTKLNHQAFANTIWDDPRKGMELHAFWKAFAHNADGDASIVAEHEMRRIEAVLLKMTDINSGFYSANTSSYVDIVGVKLDKTTDVAVETEVVVDSETDLTPEVEVEEESGKKVSLFTGTDMGDKPNHVDISNAAKKLLSEGKEEDALALAKQYFGTGNFSPRKPGQSTIAWSEKQINNWFKSIKDNVSKFEEPVTPTTEPSGEGTQDDSELQDYGKHKDTLDQESFALRDFAASYVKLATNGSEDAQAAEKLAELFFSQRFYTDKQIKTWKETVTKNEDLSTLDHFAILGPTASLSGELEDSEYKYSEFNALIKADMQELQVTKPVLEKKELLPYLIREMVKKHMTTIKGKSLKSSDDKVSYDMYTLLHCEDLIERIVTANFTESDSQVMETSEAGKEAPGKVSDSDVNTGGITDDIFSKIKEAVVTCIKNGGLLEDTLDSEVYKPFIVEGSKISNQDEMNAYLTENFKPWETEYKNSLTTYPMKEFVKAIEIGYHSEIKLFDMVEEAKTFIRKPNGKFLKLLDKAKKLEVIFPTEKELFAYIKGIYVTNKNAEGVKDVQEKTVVPKEEPKTDKVSGEATPATEAGNAEEVKEGNVELSTVKITYIENACYKALKQGKGIKGLLADRKVADLIENGGTIAGPTKDIETHYDTTSESFDKLHSDLKGIFNRISDKKKPGKNKKSLVDKAKDIIGGTKGEEPKVETPIEELVQEPSAVDTKASSITSFNDVQKPAQVLINSGITHADFLNWGYEVFLNRKMKEQSENAVFTEKDKIETLMRGMFSEFFGTSAQAEESGITNLTVEELKEVIISKAKEEDISYTGLCKEVNTLCEDNNIDLKTGERLTMVRENAPDVYGKHLEQVNKAYNEAKEKVLVLEKVSKSNPTVWDKVKGFTTLSEIYSTSTELCDAGEWQQAYNMAIELIEGGTITDAEGWTNEQITEWFDRMILKKEIAVETEIVVEEVEHLDDNFRALSQANGGKAFRNAIVNILSKNDDTTELRNSIISTIRGGEANYARKMAKKTDVILQGAINSAKAAVKPKKK